MTGITTEIATSIREAKQRLKQVFLSSGWDMDRPMAKIFGAGYPAISSSTMTSFMELVAVRVESLTEEELKNNGLGEFLSTSVSQVEQLLFHSINGNQLQVLHALTLLQVIFSALPPLIPSPKIDWVDLKATPTLLPKDLARRLKSVDSRLSQLEPRSEDVERKISEIEAAHSNAEQLPVYMGELESRRAELNDILTSVSATAAAVEGASARVASSEQSLENFSNDAKEKIAQLQENATLMIKRSEQALRGATSVGLAGAFTARADKLSTSGKAWILGLILALFAAFLIGADRVAALRDVLVSDSPSAVIWANVLLAVLGLGGPIWFAWLSTKQIGITYRLAEDYAFKASVSQAYEGYRSEAVQIDPALQQRLFSSAMSRLEEAPIRLMDSETHSSPIQELLGHREFRKALETVPGLAEKVLALIPQILTTAAVAVPVAAVAAVTTIDNAEEAEGGVSDDEEDSGSQ